MPQTAEISGYRRVDTQAGPTPQVSYSLQPAARQIRQDSAVWLVGRDLARARYTPSRP